MRDPLVKSIELHKSLLIILSRFRDIWRNVKFFLTPKILPRTYNEDTCMTFNDDEELEIDAFRNFKIYDHVVGNALITITDHFDKYFVPTFW